MFDLTKKEISKIALLLFVVFMVSIVVGYTYEIYATHLERKMVELALQDNSNKVANDSRLNPDDEIDYATAIKRVVYLKHWTNEIPQEYIEPRRAFKDLYAIISYESSWVNWNSLDDGRGFGWGSLWWTTCEWVANVHGWDWEEDKPYIKNSDVLQAKYIVGWYYLLADKYKGDRTKMMAGYKYGVKLKGEYRSELYYYIVRGKLDYLEDIWGE